MAEHTVVVSDADLEALQAVRGVIADAAGHPARDAAIAAIDRLAKPGCSRCGATLLFSARELADGLCGPCSRAASGTSTPADLERAARAAEALSLPEPLRMSEALHLFSSKTVSCTFESPAAPLVSRSSFSVED